jgi:glycosyltransferase involved in cell wall biosynthesis
MYHGSIVERHGLDLAVRALGIVRKTVPEAELRVYGSRTPFLDRVMNSVANNGVRDSVHYLGPKSLEEIVKAIEESDVGVIPNRRSIFTEINTPTRIFEYLSRAKPVIAPMVPGITDYFDQDDLVFFQLGDVDDLARKIIFVHSHSRETQEIINRGQKVYLDHNWSREKLKFLNVVGDLLAARALIPNRSPSLRRPLR